MGYTKSVVRIADDGTRTTFGSLNEAAEASLANPRLISHCCRGMQDKTAGYRWEFGTEASTFVGSQVPIILIYPDGKVERHNSISKAADASGVTVRAMSGAIKSRRRLSSGILPSKLEDYERALKKIREGKI